MYRGVGATICCPGPLATGGDGKPRLVYGPRGLIQQAATGMSKKRVATARAADLIARAAYHKLGEWAGLLAEGRNTAVLDPQCLSCRRMPGLVRSHVNCLIQGVGTHAQSFDAPANTWAADECWIAYHPVLLLGYLMQASSTATGAHVLVLSSTGGLIALFAYLAFF